MQTIESMQEIIEYIESNLDKPIEIEVLYHLGIKRMRHDVASFRRPFSTNGIKNYIQEFSLMVEGTRELHDYASTLGIHTTLENHGFL